MNLSGNAGACCVSKAFQCIAMGNGDNQHEVLAMA